MKCIGNFDWLIDDEATQLYWNEIITEIRFAVLLYTSSGNTFQYTV